MSSEATNDKQEDFKTHLMPLYEFGVHVTVGAIIFGLIALVAVGLGGFISWMQIEDSYIKQTLGALKYIIFAVDIVVA